MEMPNAAPVDHPLKPVGTRLLVRAHHGIDSGLSVASSDTAATTNRREQVNETSSPSRVRWPRPSDIDYGDPRLARAADQLLGAVGARRLVLLDRQPNGDRVDVDLQTFRRVKGETV
jgi:hypothetical protein